MSENIEKISIRQKIAKNGLTELAHAYGFVYYSTWWEQLQPIFEQIMSEEPQLKLATMITTSIPGLESRGCFMAITWDLRPWYQRIF